MKTWNLVATGIFIFLFSQLSGAKEVSKVILITGMISDEKLVDLNMIRAEARMDDSNPNGDLEIQGLDQAEKVVSSFRLKTSGSIVVHTNKGTSEQIETGSRSIMATLPDDKNIKHIKYKASRKYLHKLKQISYNI